ncbi:hypothetical protein [Pseudodesulfovibrio sp.]|uniref:hypothetical protein n=1 Tax=Pseudodesulfovibrio sp. TaxID=2035812 RepID=UPI00262BE952|nr:hypothetical protein [Pseudodesulfovibrio sp.]MDD3313073.1 hypothetical protein [Pseudodesulfovibrio sp.]
MPNRSPGFRAEVLWQNWWGEVGAVLAASARLVRREPLAYGRLALLYLLTRGSFSLVPYVASEGAVLYLLAWTAGFLVELGVLAIMVATWRTAAAQSRGESLRMPSDFALRVARAVPYGFAWYLIVDFVMGYAAWGATDALNALAGTEHGTAAFMAAQYLEGAPLAWIAARLGFVLVGIGADGRATLRESLAMTRGAVAPLCLTFLLWWVARRAFTDAALFLLPMEASAAYLDWVARPLRAVVTVFFAVTAAVWYERLGRAVPAVNRNIEESH